MKLLLPRDRFRFSTNHSLDEAVDKIEQVMSDADYYGTQADHKFLIAPIRKAMMSSSLIVRGIYKETEEGTDVEITAQPGGVEFLCLLVDVFIIWRLIQNLMAVDWYNALLCLAGFAVVQLYLYTCFWRPEQKLKKKLIEIFGFEPEPMKKGK